MLGTLNRWNIWGTAQLEPGVHRDVTDQVLSFLDTENTLMIKGPRRAGKSTVMYQLIHTLLQRGISKDAILYMNLEEPALGPKLSVETLDKLYDTYRAHIFPSGKAYVFLDEIQNVPDWERWVRARAESENIQIILTGSSAYLSFAF